MATLMDSKRWGIMKFFLESPTTEVHLRALARQLEISPTWIGKVIPELKKQNLIILTKNKETRLISLKAKRDASEFIALKRSINLYDLQNCNLIEKLIEEYNKPEAIILFGSYSKGADIEKGDIDLAVVSSRKVNINLSKFEKRLKRKINLIALNKNSISKEFKETLANGVVLYGYLEL